MNLQPRLIYIIRGYAFNKQLHDRRMPIAVRVESTNKTLFCNSISYPYTAFKKVIGDMGYITSDTILMELYPEYFYAPGTVIELDYVKILSHSGKVGASTKFEHCFDEHSVPLVTIGHYQDVKYIHSGYGYEKETFGWGFSVSRDVLAE